MEKKIISTCCESSVQHLPAGIMSKDSVFVCTTCNKICKVKVKINEKPVQDIYTK